MGNSLPITGGRGNIFVFMLKWNLVNPVTNRPQKSGLIKPGGRIKGVAEIETY